MLSKNAASSRAIPVKKVLAQLLHDPYIPRWGKNQAGMQSYTPITDEEYAVASRRWLQGRDQMMELAEDLAGEHTYWCPDRGFFRFQPGEKPGAPWKRLWLHKQDVNRALEPWMYATVIVSGTDFLNLFKLRDHHAAHPGIQAPIKRLHELYWSEKPMYLQAGEWSLPYVTPEERRDDRLTLQDLQAFAVARCARVSALNHDTGEIDQDADRDLHQRLLNPAPDEEDPPMHASPFEHVAMALKDRAYYGNFCGFLQLRKTLPRERTPEPIWAPDGTVVEGEWR